MPRLAKKIADLEAARAAVKAGCYTIGEVAEKLGISYERARQRLIILDKLRRIGIRGRGGRGGYALIHLSDAPLLGPAPRQTEHWSSYGHRWQTGMVPGATGLGPVAGVLVQCECDRKSVVLTIGAKEGTCDRCGREYLLVICVKTRGPARGRTGC